MSPKQKRIATEWWAVEKPRRDAAREARGRHFIEAKELDEYFKVIQKVQGKLLPPEVPAMPTTYLTPHSLFFALHRQRIVQEKSSQSIEHGKPSQCPAYSTTPEAKKYPGAEYFDHRERLHA